MKHKQSVQELQRIIAPHRAAGWFIRGRIWALGYWKDGQRIELARGDDKCRTTERTFNEAVRAWRREV